MCVCDCYVILPVFRLHCIKKQIIFNNYYDYNFNCKQLAEKWKKNSPPPQKKTVSANRKNKLNPVKQKKSSIHKINSSKNQVPHGMPICHFMCVMWRSDREKQNQLPTLDVTWPLLPERDLGPSGMRWKNVVLVLCLCQQNINQVPYVNCYMAALCEIQKRLPIHTQRPRDS